MVINFFKYEKNCQDFKVLLKATSKNATRKNLKEGQQLFKSIYQNIVAIELKLSEIEQSITNRNLENFGTREKELLDLGKFKIEYEPNLEQNLEIKHQQNLEYYYGLIQPDIEEIFKFLDSNFDHEMNGNYSIEKSIENVLEHYSIISVKLIEYLTLFLKYKNLFYQI